MLTLAILFGAVVGVSLGLTGGGGGILAVPMLVYGVGVEPHQALLVSLLAVGVTALVGAVERIRRNEVAIRIGILFALLGMIGAPLGARLAHRTRADHLLLMFSVLMVIVAVRMWTKSSPRHRFAGNPHPQLARGLHARHKWDAAQVMIMALLGLATGVLSGLFGIGGGFLIVPALVLVGGMEIHRAVATSLLVIPLVSITGIIQHLRQQHALAVDVTMLFVVGGVVGMGVGTVVGRRLPAAKLQRVFAVVIIAVAVFNVVMTLQKQNEEPRRRGGMKAPLVRPTTIGEPAQSSMLLHRNNDHSLQVPPCFRDSVVRSHSAS